MVETVGYVCGIVYKLDFKITRAFNLGTHKVEHFGLSPTVETVGYLCDIVYKLDFKITQGFNLGTHKLSILDCLQWLKPLAMFVVLCINLGFNTTQAFNLGTHKVEHFGLSPTVETVGYVCGIVYKLRFQYNPSFQLWEAYQ